MSLNWDTKNLLKTIKFWQTKQKQTDRQIDKQALTDPDFQQEIFTSKKIKLIDSLPCSQPHIDFLLLVSCQNLHLLLAFCFPKYRITNKPVVCLLCDLKTIFSKLWCICKVYEDKTIFYEIKLEMFKLIDVLLWNFRHRFLLLLLFFFLFYFLWESVS